LEISSTNITLDGELSARGGAGFILAGAGGSIHIDTGVLSGSGAMDVKGGNGDARFTRYSGAGGRLSIYADDVSGYSGELRVASGEVNRSSGSGTAYIKLPSEPLGRLLIDNGGRLSPVGGTPLKKIGRHTITAIESLGGDNWRVDVAGTPWQASMVESGIGLQGASVILDSTDTAGPAYLIESNDTNALYLSTSDDLSPAVGQELVGITRLDTLQVLNKAHLSAGDDIIVVEDLAGSDTSTGFVDAGAGSVLP
jgi:hypothetical protein